MDKKKLTVVEKFEDAISLLNGETPEHGMTAEQAVVFLQERMAQTIKKNASGSKADRKPTAKQLENAGVKEQILNILSTSVEPMTASDIGKAIGCDNNYRISALLGQMVKVTAGGKVNESGVLDRTESKGRAYFAIAK